jgi:hypothetical protein
MASPKMSRPVWLEPKKEKEKRYVGPRSTQPDFFGLDPVTWAGPLNIFNYIIYYNISQFQKKYKKNPYKNM